MVLIIFFTLWQQQDKKNQLQLFLQQYAEIVALHLRPTFGQLSNEQLLQQLAELQFSALLPISAIGIYQQQGHLTAASGQLESLPSQLTSPAYTQFVLHTTAGHLWAVYPLRSYFGLADQFIPVNQTAAWLVIVPEQSESSLHSLLPAFVAWFLLTLLLAITLLLWRFQQKLRQTSILQLQQCLQQQEAEVDNQLPAEFASLQSYLDQQLTLHNARQQQLLLHESQLQQLELKADHAVTVISQLQQQAAERQQRVTHWLHQLELLWQRREQLPESCFKALLRLHQVYAAEVFAERNEALSNVQLNLWLQQKLPDYTALLAESTAVDWLEGANNSQYQLTVDPVRLDAIFTAMLLVCLRSDSARRLLFRLSLQTTTSPQLLLQLNIDGNGLASHVLPQFPCAATPDWLWRDVDLALLRLLESKLQAKLDIASLEGLGVSISFTLPVTVEVLPASEQLGQLLLFDTDPERLAERLALLNARALRVASCHSFTDLQQRIQQQRFDTVIIMLPGQLPNAEWQQFLLNSPVSLVTYAQPFTYNAWRRVSPCYSSNEFSFAQLTHAIKQQSVRQPKRLLVVDDNETNQAFIKILLQHKPVSITAAYTAAQAVSLCHSQQFDMVLLDIRLPDQSGVEVAQQLRQLSGYHDIPVLAFTAHALATEIAEFKAAGMDDILLKPLDPCKFDRLLSTYKLY